MTPTDSNSDDIGDIPAKAGSLAPHELLKWLRRKIADAEKALKMREEMAVTWRTGTNAEWAAAAMMHHATAGKVLKKSDRLKEATMHERIAIKLRHELAMFRAVHAALSASVDGEIKADK